MGHDSIVNRNNSVLSLQGSVSGGAVNLESGHSDDEGFYVALAPDATEGVLKVTLLEGTTPVVLPFFKGYSNPVLIKEIHVDGGNTATSVYWYK
jgi:hypothetical protein